MTFKVSVIIPLYNAEKQIVETLESVLSQTYSNLEIIIIDDHSSDRSYEIALGYKSEKVIVEKNKKKGACAARNYGFELSSGEYIQYLDADDLLSPNKIGAQLNMVDDGVEKVIYSCKWMHFESSIQNAVYNVQPIDKDYSYPHLWLRDSWTGNGMAANSMWLTHRSLIASTGGWNESLLINQDGEFFSRIILQAKKIKFSNDAIVYYRKGNQNSVSQSNKYSNQKAISLLNSYILYKQSTVKHEKFAELKFGLAQNFLMFIYQYYNLFPDLIKQAEQEFYSLGYKTMWPVGGNKFQQFAKILGFENLLKIRKLLKGKNV